jgi:hypothetical protein
LYGADPSQTCVKEKNLAREKELKGGNNAEREGKKI